MIKQKKTFSDEPNKKNMISPITTSLQFFSCQSGSVFGHF